MNLPGLDAGAPQGAISPAAWLKVATEGRRFAFLRCEEGTGGVDPTFAGNVYGARAAGLLVGAYFVYQPGADPSAQATAWLRTSSALGTRPGELPPVIDFELASRALSPDAELAALCALVRAMTLAWGRSPIVYTYPDFWRRQVLAYATADELALLSTCLLWYAAYQGAPPTPPAPFPRIAFWQSSGGNAYRVPSGAPCDADYCLLSELELAQLASFARPVDVTDGGQDLPVPIPIATGDCGR